MQDLNKVYLTGRVTRDLELRYTPNGTAVVDVGFASNRKFGETEETVFVDMTAWGKTAEILVEHAGKGKQLLIEGRLRLEAWEDKEGNKRSKLSVVVEDFKFMGAKVEQ